MSKYVILQVWFSASFLLQHVELMFRKLVCRYDAGVEIRTSRSADAYTVDVTADPVRPMVLHWAVNEWQAPPPDSWPPGTNQVCPISHFALTVPWCIITQ